MAIIPYHERNINPEYADRLADIHAHSLLAKSMLTALGDYWTNYYRNLDPITTAASGSVASISKEYTKLLDLVKSANVLDVPLTQTSPFELLVIKVKDIEVVKNSNGDIDYYFVPVDDVVETRYLTTTLFESRVVLEKGIHYDVILHKGYKFYVDLFNDRGITGFTFEVGEDRDRGMLLWASDIAFTSTVIYDRYGRFLYKKAADSEQYKWLVSGLMRFYESAKSVSAIQEVLNVMYGIPYSRYKDEVVEEIYHVDKNLQRVLSQIEEPYICIRTDRAHYYTYAFSELRYKVGDVIPRFSLLADFNKVEDYITKPGWWEDKSFPYALIDGADELSADAKNELMDKVLKYNTVHIDLGISFETYATYCAQVKEFFRIIEGGFPVYLYPLVDTFFRAVFLDNVDIKEELDNLLVRMREEQSYPWGTSLKFNGEVTYYMEPERDFGRNSWCEERIFDGTETYDGTGKHKCEDKNILHHTEDDGTYDTGFKYDFGNDREKLLIWKANYRFSENFPWDTSPNIPGYALTYSNMTSANGEKFFGEILAEDQNERLRLTAKWIFNDRLPMPAESEFTLVMKNRPLRDAYACAVFDGSFDYCTQMVPQNPDTYLEDVCFKKGEMKIAENYPWETSNNRKEVPIIYSNQIRADGAFNYNSTLEIVDNDPLIGKITTGFFDSASIDEMSVLKIRESPVSDTFGTYIFDGKYSYGGIPDVNAGYRENFSFRVVNS